MPIAPEEFKEKITAIVRDHYATSRTPLLLARLGATIEKEDAWPIDRRGRSLKQLLKECGAPDLDIVWDKRSPAYIVVVTPDVRSEIEAQIAQRQRTEEPATARLEDIARPVLLAFCVRVPDGTPVYVRRSRPFRYEVGPVPPDQASQYIIVESEYRRPDLRIDSPSLLQLSDRRDLEGRIQRWAAVHALRLEQFSKLDQEEKEAQDYGKTALDRLLEAQPQDVAQRLLIPADIAQILGRIR